MGRARHAGGGGWGDPRERDPAAVRADVADGKVTPDAARELYGFTGDALAGDGFTGDELGPDGFADDGPAGDGPAGDGAGA